MGWCWSDRELGIAVSGTGGQDSHGRRRPWLGCICTCVSLWDGSRCATPSSKGIGDRVFGRYEVATVVMQILLIVGGFDVDVSAELTLLDVNIDIQEGDMGLGGVPGEVERIATVQPFKEGDEGFWTMWPE